jgi:hypothetical protein
MFPGWTLLLGDCLLRDDFRKLMRSSMFSYGYVVKLPNGRLVRAGQDWGMTLDFHSA